MTTTNPLTSDFRETKLPRWAQDELSRLRQALREEREANTVPAKGQSRVMSSSSLDYRPESPKVILPDDAHVRFFTDKAWSDPDDGRRHHADVSIGGGGIGRGDQYGDMLHITGITTMRIIPMAANHVVIHMPPYDR